MTVEAPKRATLTAEIKMLKATGDDKVDEMRGTDREKSGQRAFLTKETKEGQPLIRMHKR